MICRNRRKQLIRTQWLLWIVPILALATSLVEAETEAEILPICWPGQFDCQSEPGCISISWVCDTELDCSNGLDERQSCCSEGKHFECVSDGLCVDLKFRCDSFSDCKDSSDERNCTGCAPDRNLFLCGSGRCVDPVFVCDQDNDCGDFSDELNCDKRNPGSYLCQNEQLRVEEGKLCDGVNDCGDMSDEVGCAPCEAFHFPCSDGSGCVLMFDLCDDIDQCLDGSDESWCGKCSKSQYQCNNGQCVSRSQVCNYEDDCGDNSDEEVCSCKSGAEFQCLSGLKEYLNASNVKCIPDSWVCDMMDDCRDGEDERPDLCKEREEQNIPECSADQFECADGVCISNGMVCDGVDNCFRGEDEISCPSMCPRGTYQLCLTSSECISYSQFCNGHRDCSDNSDESFSNGYCFCSGVLCGDKCVPVQRICDSTWDCQHGEDEQDCTQCRTSLESTTSLIDQTVFVISLIKTTYTEMDSFQIYFGSLGDRWSILFGSDDSSPFHLNVESHDPDAQQLVREAQEFLISIVTLRPTLRQFMSVMNELGLTNEKLPRYEHSQTLNGNHEDIPRMKRYIIERTASSEAYKDLIARFRYLRQKSTDSIQILGAVTKMLHYEFTSCRDLDYWTVTQGDPTMEYRKKRSMREVFTALTLVLNNIPREKVDKFVNKLYDLNDQLHQLILSVVKFDETITAVAFLIDDARDRLEELLTEDETDLEVSRKKRDNTAKELLPKFENYENAMS